MRLVLDTNCLLSIVPKKSPYRWIFDLVIGQKLEVAISTEILLEYEEQLSHFYSTTYSENIICALVSLPNVVEVNPIHFNWRLIEGDPDDDKFVDTYIASRSDILLTNDRHFNKLQSLQFPKVVCVKLTEFRFP